MSKIFGITKKKIIKNRLKRTHTCKHKHEQSTHQYNEDTKNSTQTQAYRSFEADTHNKTFKYT